MTTPIATTAATRPLRSCAVSVVVTSASVVEPSRGRAVVPFGVAWALILLVFLQLDLPLGPGNDILVQQGG